MLFILISTFTLCIWLCEMVPIYIQRKAEKINRLALSMLDLEITALKDMKALALEFLKESSQGNAPHPPSFQIYKRHLPECKELNKSRSQTWASHHKWQNSTCQRTSTLTQRLPNKIKKETVVKKSTAQGQRASLLDKHKHSGHPCYQIRILSTFRLSCKAYKKSAGLRTQMNQV